MRSYPFFVTFAIFAFCFPLPLAAQELISCAVNFTRSLNSIEETHRVPLYTRFLEMKKPDAALPPLPIFQPLASFTKMKEGREAFRLYNLLRNRAGSDPIFLTTNVLGDSLNRSLGEWKGFLTQKATAGICSGLPEFLEFYRVRLKDFATRKALYDQSLKASIAYYNQIQKPEQPALTVETLDQMPGLEAGNPNPALSLILTLFIGQQRFATMSNETSNFFNSIEMAHKRDCTCTN